METFYRKAMIFLVYDFVMVFLTAPFFPSICLKIAVGMLVFMPWFGAILYWWEDINEFLDKHES